MMLAGAHATFERASRVLPGPTSGLALETGRGQSLAASAATNGRARFEASATTDCQGKNERQRCG
jgi:hypothetical protein